MTKRVPPRWCFPWFHNRVNREVAIQHLITRSKFFRLGACLDTAKHAAYTMEFLDGPKIHAYRSGNGHGQETPRLLQKEAGRPARGAHENHRAHRRGRPPGG